MLWQRRWVRLGSLVLYLGAAYGLWTAFTLPNQMLTFTKRYDPTRTVSISVQACDVVFLPGEEPRMEYVARTGVAVGLSGLWVDDPTDSSLAVGANARNVDAVTAAPQEQDTESGELYKQAQGGCNPPRGIGDCARICKLNVYVPPGGVASFDVKQFTDDVDSGRPEVSVRSGVQLASLTVGAWWRVPPTLRATILDATISRLALVLGRGDATLIGATVESLSIHVRTGGSVRMQRHRAPPDAILPPPQRTLTAPHNGRALCSTSLRGDTAPHRDRTPLTATGPHLDRRDPTSPHLTPTPPQPLTDPRARPQRRRPKRRDEMDPALQPHLRRHRRAGTFQRARPQRARLLVQHPWRARRHLECQLRRLFHGTGPVRVAAHRCPRRLPRRCLRRCGPLAIVHEGTRTHALTSARVGASSVGTRTHALTSLTARVGVASVGRYDENRNGRVTKQEFLNGVGQLDRCCGGSAPFACWCASHTHATRHASPHASMGRVALSLHSPHGSVHARRGRALACRCEDLAYQVFPPVDASFYDRFDVTFPTFMGYLLAQNMTNLIGKPAAPSCEEALVAGDPANITRRMSLRSDRGEVIVSLKQSTSGAQLYNASTYTPSDKHTGVRLLRDDALRLKERYGPTVGDRTSTGSVYLIIDAFADGFKDAEDGLHVPRGRWVYTTHPALLVFAPAFFSFLSFGGLAPTIAHERVTFLNNDCHLDPLNESTLNTTLSTMYEQIHRSLHSSPHDLGSLRGTLVLQKYDRVSWGSGDFYQFPTLAFADGSAQRERTPWRSLTLQVRLLSAVVLSTAFSAVLGLILLFAFDTVVLRQQRHETTRREASRVMTLLRHYPYLSTVELRKALREQQEDEDNSAANWTSLEQPFKLLRQFLVRPLERRSVSSIDRFVTERMVRPDGGSLGGVSQWVRDAIDDGEDPARHMSGSGLAKEVEPRAKSFIYMRNIFRQCAPPPPHAPPGHTRTTSTDAPLPRHRPPVPASPRPACAQQPPPYRNITPPLSPPQPDVTLPRAASARPHLTPPFPHRHLATVCSGTSCTASTRTSRSSQGATSCSAASSSPTTRASTSSSSRASAASGGVRTRSRSCTSILLAPSPSARTAPTVPRAAACSRWPTSDGCASSSPSAAR
jgi:hypothetical protein